MRLVLSKQTDLYNQFHSSPAGPEHFYLPGNEDVYVAYYTSMYLIQDTAEAVLSHMQAGFNADPMKAYLEFWGVMQAIVIQQDAICELHNSIVGSKPSTKSLPNWRALRDKRNLCAGHPAARTSGVPGIQRAFMGRNFGSYNRIQYELWDSATNNQSHPTFDLHQLITGYDNEASTSMDAALISMRAKWP